MSALTPIKCELPQDHYERKRRGKDVSGYAYSTPSPASPSSSPEVPKEGPDAAVQQLSIHRISIRKVCRLFSIQSSEASCSDIIARIIAVYNSKKERFQYRVIVPHAKAEPFDLMVCVKKVRVKSGLARWAESLSEGVDLTTVKIDFLCFYHRQLTPKTGEPDKEIFALTSGHAYHVVQKFSDFRFPRQVAQRLFSPEIRSSTTRPLVGRVLLYSEILKQGVRVSEIEAVDRLFMRMKFDFRGDASVFKFPFFQTRGKPRKQGMSAEFGLGLVRLNKSLVPTSYPQLLSHFSQIARREPTYCFLGKRSRVEKEERDFDEFDFLDYLYPVDFSLRSQLNNTLIELIYQAVKNNDNFPPLDFCHRHQSDYFSGSDYYLHYGTRIEECSDPFSSAQMVKMLGEIDALKNAENRKTFAKELEEVKVSFCFKKQKKEGPFIDFLEGEVRVASGDVYWRLRTMWYEVRADYLGLVHQEFGRLLDTVLLDCRNNCSLTHRWPTQAQKKKRKQGLIELHRKSCPTIQQKKKCQHKVYETEAEYNQSYLSTSNFFVGDKICPQGVELFDVMHWTKKQLFLYHVKEGFGQKTRDACSQIYQAAQQMHSLRQRGATKIIKEFYKMASQYNEGERYRTAVKNQILDMGEEAFLQLFNKEIAFVYAFADDAKGKRFLSSDKKLKTSITPKGLEKAHKKFASGGENLFQALVEAEYLTAKGFLTSKFFACSDNSFVLEMLPVKAQRKALYKYLKGFQSVFDTTIAKLELLRLEKELDRLHYKLRICQIPRSDYKSKATFPIESFAKVEVLKKEDEEELKQERRELQIGDKFIHGGVTYRIDHTVGDGACALHALSGIRGSRGYFFSQARKLFVEDLRKRREDLQDKYTDCLVALLKDYLVKKPSIYVKWVFDPLEELRKGLDEDLSKLNKERQRLKVEQEQYFQNLVEDNDLQEVWEKKFGCDIQSLQKNAEKRYNSFSSDLNGVLALLKNSKIKGSLLKNKQSRQALDEKNEKLYREFVNKKELFEAYLLAVQNSNYYFSDAEIKFAAYLFNKRVKLFAHSFSDQVYDPKEYGDEKNSLVVIFHKGIHYSRCNTV